MVPTRLRAAADRVRERRLLADCVEKLFWARFCATSIQRMRLIRIIDSIMMQRRFWNCVTAVRERVFQHNRRIYDFPWLPVNVRVLALRGRRRLQIIWHSAEQASAQRPGGRVDGFGADGLARRDARKLALHAGDDSRVYWLAQMIRWMKAISLKAKLRSS